MGEAMTTVRPPLYSIYDGPSIYIDDEVIDAFEKRDLWRLQHLLHLGFSHYSPLTEKEGGPYGHPARRPSTDSERIMPKTWDAAVAIRKQILEAIAKRDERARR
jgi:hypothetical protein